MAPRASVAGANCSSQLPSGLAAARASSAPLASRATSLLSLPRRGAHGDALGIGAKFERHALRRTAGGGRCIEEGGAIKRGIRKHAPIQAAGGAEDADADEGCGEAPVAQRRMRERALHGRGCRARACALDGAPSLHILDAFRA